MSLESLLDDVRTLAREALELVHPAALAGEPGLAATLAQVEGMLTTDAVWLSAKVKAAQADADRAEALEQEQEVSDV